MTEWDIIFWFLASLTISIWFFVVSILAIIIFNKPVRHLLWSKFLKDLKKSAKF